MHVSIIRRLKVLVHFECVICWVLYTILWCYWSSRVYIYNVGQLLADSEKQTTLA